MLSQKQKQETEEAEASAEEKRRVRESALILSLRKCVRPQIEKEKRKAKVQKVQSETAAMLQETPEQRADRLAQELIEVVHDAIDLD